MYKFASLAVAAFLFVAIAPASQANHTISSPVGNVMTIAGGAEAAAGAVSGGATGFSTTTQANAGNVQAQLGAQQTPDGPLNTQITDTGGLGAVAIGAGQGFGVLALNQAGLVVVGKINEAGFTANDAIGVANTGIGAGFGLGATAAAAVCASPLSPPDAPVCGNTSVLDAAQDNASNVSDAAGDAVDGVNANSTLCALKTGLNGLVTGSGDGFSNSDCPAPP